MLCFGNFALRGFRCRCFSLAIRALVPCRFRAESLHPTHAPLHAGRRLPSHQAPDDFVPEGLHAFGFDDIKLLNDASSMGLLLFAPFGCSPARGLALSFCSNAHDHGLFTAAASSGLTPAPESRSRVSPPSLFTQFKPLAVRCRVLPSFPCVSAAHYSRENRTCNLGSLRVDYRPRNRRLFDHIWMQRHSALREPLLQRCARHVLALFFHCDDGRSHHRRIV